MHFTKWKLTQKHKDTFIIMTHTQRTCEVNTAGENSSFIVTVCVKSVLLYHFKLAYVVIHTAVKEFLKKDF